MKILRPILIGFSFGLLLDVLFWNLGPYSWDSWILNFLVYISSPVAHIIAWIKGWPLQQEAAIYCYTYAIVITLPLLGVILGIGFRLGQKRLKSNERNS